MLQRKSQVQAKRKTAAEPGLEINTGCKNEEAIAGDNMLLLRVIRSR